MERCRLLRLGKGGHNRFDHASRESQSGTDVTTALPRGSNSSQGDVRVDEVPQTQSMRCTSKEVELLNFTIYLSIAECRWEDECPRVGTSTNPVTIRLVHEIQSVAIHEDHSSNRSTMARGSLLYASRSRAKLNINVTSASATAGRQLYRQPLVTA